MLSHSYCSYSLRTISLKEFSTLYSKYCFITHLEPSAAPTNVRGHNTSSTSILVEWDEVPAADENGFITSYTIAYQSLTQNHNGSVTVDYLYYHIRLTGLKEYVNYSITVFASTVKGDGPISNPIIITTDQPKSKYKSGHIYTSLINIDFPKDTI